LISNQKKQNEFDLIHFLGEFDLTHYKVVEWSLSLNSFGLNEFASLI